MRYSSTYGREKQLSVALPILERIRDEHPLLIQARTIPVELPMTRHIMVRGGAHGRERTD